MVDTESSDHKAEAARVKSIRDALIDCVELLGVNFAPEIANAKDTGYYCLKYAHLWLCLIYASERIGCFPITPNGLKHQLKNNFNSLFNSANAQQQTVLKKIEPYFVLALPGNVDPEVSSSINSRLLNINDWDNVQAWEVGTVYEELMSYGGIYCDEVVFELGNPQKGTMFYKTQAEIDLHECNDFIMRDKQGNPISHPVGSFLYKPSNRSRQQSASFYTPSCLADCLTKYTFMEKCKGMKALDLLELTICEPAMGTGNISISAVNHLAKLYLERRQEELGQSIEADRYDYELCQVKMHITDNQIYGVDLNKEAMEIGGLVLWLNCL